MQTAVKLPLYPSRFRRPALARRAIHLADDPHSAVQALAKTVP